MLTFKQEIFFLFIAKLCFWSTGQMCCWMCRKSSPFFICILKRFHYWICIKKSQILKERDGWFCTYLSNYKFKHRKKICLQLRQLKSGYNCCFIACWGEKSIFQGHAFSFICLPLNLFFLLYTTQHKIISYSHWLLSDEYCLDLKLLTLA